MNKLYELTYLVSSDFSEEELKTFCDKIGGFITETAGIIENQSNFVKKRLAYPIKKKTEAFLTTITFKIDSNNLEKIERKLKSENEVLRYIIIAKKPIKKIKEMAAYIPSEKISAKKKKIIHPLRQEERKIKLKEIDKKIEEILNQ